MEAEISLAICSLSLTPSWRSRIQTLILYCIKARVLRALLGEIEILKKMEELRDKNPFHCIITGPTNCGKTRYVIDQLRGSFRHVFDWIVLICPTYSKNKTYRGFAKGDKRFVVLSPDESNVEEINDLLGI